MIDLSENFKVWCPGSISLMVGHKLDIRTKRSELENSVVLLNVFQEVLRKRMLP